MRLTSVYFQLDVQPDGEAGCSSESAGPSLKSATRALSLR